MKGSVETLFISFDIEADGETPALHSMIALGAVAFVRSGREVSTWQSNIMQRADRTPSARCMNEFWRQHPDAWAEVLAGPKTPRDAMMSFATWYAELKTTYTSIKFVAAPAAFDWQWLLAYYREFAPPSAPDLGYMATCVSTLREAYKLVRGRDARTCDELAGGANACPHNPLSDARYQMRTFLALVEDLEATDTGALV